MTQIIALWSDMPGVQYTCETELGLFVMMLLEAGRLISLLCWLRPNSQTDHIYSYLVHLVFTPQAS